jgi:hypothetical protein
MIMNPNTNKTSSEKRPTADELAGIAACFEEKSPIEGRKSRVVKACGTATATTMLKIPTPDDLAGIPVCAEGVEDLTVRPRSFLPPK